MSEAGRGVVINVHALGATVRLEDGSLAVIPSDELKANRPTIVRSRDSREPIQLFVEADGRRAVARIAPSRGGKERSVSPLVDPAFESRLTAYLKSVEEWAPPDRPDPAERHFIRKKRRAAQFEARVK